MTQGPLPGKIALRKAVANAVGSTASRRKLQTSVFCVGLLGAAIARADLFPPVVELNDLLPANGGDGTDGVVIDGPSLAISSAGDVNNDGKDDIQSVAADNSLFVILSREDGLPPQSDMLDLLPENGGNGDDGFVVRSDILPIPAKGIDFDNDGTEDVFIGYPTNSVGSGNVLGGSASVIYGGDDFLAQYIDGTGVPGSQGSRIAASFPYGLLGGDIADVGDMNGDGLDDVALSAGGNYVYGERTAFIIFGRTSSPGFNLSTGTILTTGEGGVGLKGFPAEVAGGGDVNGDGMNDLLMSREYRCCAFEQDQGYILFGRDTPFPANGAQPGEFDLGSLNPANGGDGTDGVFLEFGPTGGYAYDSGASMAADVNGDGLADVIISTFDTQNQKCTAYVLYGRDDGFPPSVQLDSLAPEQGGDGSQGFLITSPTETCNFQYRGVQSFGDVNDDGLTDLVIDADRDPTTVLFGNADGFPAVVDAADLGDLPHFEISGADRAVAGGDLNGDRVDDMLFSQSAGDRVFVLYGRRDTTTDSDADGVANFEDNCTELANPDQLDANGDGFGNRCDPDFNDDLQVNFIDLGVMKAVFFSGNTTADLNGDGSVNFVDLGILKEFFFRPPGPSGLVRQAAPPAEN